MTTMQKEGGGVRLSANLHSDEVACRCGCGAWKASSEIVTLFQAVRDELGSLNVNSGYRCPVHNSNIGGVSQSQHMTGHAMDIASRVHPPALVAERVEHHMRKLDIKGGVGRYESFTHIDTRGTVARWAG